MPRPVLHRPGGVKARLDQRLVTLGLADSRSRAQALIASGAVRVGGHAVTKPARAVDDAAVVTLVRDTPHWVSRGALKLLHALDYFDLSPEGAQALDVGASTGGFTQVLLSRDAAHVDAIDVGHGQMAAEVARDARVRSVERLNARDLTLAHLSTAPDWIVTDVSFIGLEKALPAALSLAAPGATLVALVKPQFEVGRTHIGKGGVVRDAAARDAAVTRVLDWLIGLGWTPLGQTQSPIEGGSGNIEYLVAARRP